MMKPDCYKCKWKGEVIGSAHISCHHPSFGEINDNPLLQMLGILSSVRRVPATKILPQTGIKVIGDPVGIRRGWFNHPFNFDPTWLVSCNGFKKNDKK